MEVTLIHVIGILGFLNFFLLCFSVAYLNYKINELPYQEIEQITQTQHILMGISQFLESSVLEKARQPDLMENAKQMIPILIGKKLFPNFFEDLGLGKSNPIASLTNTLTANNTEGHGARTQNEEE